MNSGPKDPISPLGEAAAGLHEMYKELRNAGFNRSEAIELVAKVIQTSMGQTSDE